jgi:hypothetical protein
MPPVSAANARLETGPDRPHGRPYVCLGCGAPMIEIGCKIRCRACGYFEDCGGGLTPPPVDARG